MIFTFILERFFFFFKKRKRSQAQSSSFWRGPSFSSSLPLCFQYQNQLGFHRQPDLAGKFNRCFQKQRKTRPGFLLLLFPNLFFAFSFPFPLSLAWMRFHLHLQPRLSQQIISHSSSLLLSHSIFNFLSIIIFLLIFTFFKFC
jgi:hypothetical protein